MSHAEGFAYFQVMLFVFMKGVLAKTITLIIGKCMSKPCLKQIKDESEVYAVTWSAGEQFLATGSDDNSVRVYKGGGDFPLLRIFTYHQDCVFALAFSRIGSLLASGGGDGCVFVVNLENNFNMAANLNSRTCAVFSLCFAPNSLYAGHRDGSIRKYAVYSNFAVLATVFRHGAPIHSLKNNANGDMLASGSWDGTIKVYRTTSMKAFKTLTDHKNAVNVVSFSGDENWLASGGDDCYVMVYNVKNGFALVKKMEDHTDPVYSLCFTSDSRHLLTGSDDEIIRVYDCSNAFNIVKSFHGAHNGPVRSLSISRKYLASGGRNDYTVNVWALEYK
jgi:WD40 repeat protein